MLQSRIDQERFCPLGADKTSALMALYLSKRSAVERFLTARLGNKDEAEDILQELFLKLSRVDPAQEIQNPAGYLFKMALNLAHDRRRERSRARERDSDWVVARYIMAGPEPVADIPSAEAGYHAKQRIAAVHTAIEELSPQCRRVFVLHKFENFSHEDIARQLGISRSTVEKHMNTALKQLIRKLGRD
jgi:RNA polymerase sigma factor (sigma-70 family)